MQNIRTDLASEAYEMLMEAAQELSGVSSEEEERKGMKITRVEIHSEEAQEKMGKPCGNYVTVEIPNAGASDREEYEAACRILSDEIKKLTGLREGASVLVVGLGNWNVTPDALGPEVVSQLMVTRHLLEYVPEHVEEGIRPVCAISPGVLGITGMETGEIIRGVTEKIRPDLVIAVDALAARSMERIHRTVQLCDTGIAPGAGVGNKRKELSRDTLGVPVIAIGVPTVIDAATIAADAMQSITDAMLESAGKNAAFYQTLSNMNHDEQRQLAKEALSPRMSDFIVTPKEVDRMIQQISKIVANGINLALHDHISFRDIEAYVS